MRHLLDGFGEGLGTTSSPGSCEDSPWVTAVLEINVYET